MVSLLTIYALLVLILGSVAFAIARLVGKLPDYANAFDQIFTSLLDLSTRLGFGQEQLERLASSVQLSSLAGPAQALLSGISGGVSLLLLIVTVVIFLAFEAASMPERLGVIRETRPHIADGLSNFATRVRKYWIVTTVFGFIVAVLDVIALAIIGVPLFVTWGVLAFVTNYIPNIGFILGVIPRRSSLCLTAEWAAPSPWWSSTRPSMWWFRPSFSHGSLGTRWVSAPQLPLSL